MASNFNASLGASQASTTPAPFAVFGEINNNLPINAAVPLRSAHQTQSRVHRHAVAQGANLRGAATPAGATPGMALVRAAFDDVHELIVMGGEDDVIIMDANAGSSAVASSESAGANIESSTDVNTTNTASSAASVTSSSFAMYAPASSPASATPAVTFAVFGAAANNNGSGSQVPPPPHQRAAHQTASRTSLTAPAAAETGQAQPDHGASMALAAPSVQAVLPEPGSIPTATPSVSLVRGAWEGVHTSIVSAAALLPGGGAVPARHGNSASFVAGNNVGPTLDVPQAVSEHGSSSHEQENETLEATETEFDTAGEALGADCYQHAPAGMPSAPACAAAGETGEAEVPSTVPGPLAQDELEAVMTLADGHGVDASLSGGVHLASTVKDSADATAASVPSVADEAALPTGAAAPTTLRPAEHAAGASEAPVGGAAAAEAQANAGDEVMQQAAAVIASQPAPEGDSGALYACLPVVAAAVEDATDEETSLPAALAVTDGSTAGAIITEDAAAFESSAQRVEPESDSVAGVAAVAAGESGTPAEGLRDCGEVEVAALVEELVARLEAEVGVTGEAATDSPAPARSEDPRHPDAPVTGTVELQPELEAAAAMHVEQHEIGEYQSAPFDADPLGLGDAVAACHDTGVAPVAEAPVAAVAPGLPSALHVVADQTPPPASYTTASTDEQTEPALPALTPPPAQPDRASAPVTRTLAADAPEPFAAPPFMHGVAPALLPVAVAVVPPSESDKRAVLVELGVAEPLECTESPAPAFAASVAALAAAAVSTSAGKRTAGDVMPPIGGGLYEEGDVEMATGDATASSAGEAPAAAEPAQPTPPLQRKRLRIMGTGMPMSKPKSAPPAPASATKQPATSPSSSGCGADGDVCTPLAPPAPRQPPGCGAAAAIMASSGPVGSGGGGTGDDEDGYGAPITEEMVAAAREASRRARKAFAASFKPPARSLPPTPQTPAQPPPAKKARVAVDGEEEKGTSSGGGAGYTFGRFGAGLRTSLTFSGGDAWGSAGGGGGGGEDALMGGEYDGAAAGGDGGGLAGSEAEAEGEGVATAGALAHGEVQTQGSAPTGAAAAAAAAPRRKPVKSLAPKVVMPPSKAAPAKGAVAAKGKAAAAAGGK